MKLFFKSITNLFTAKAVQHALNTSKKATYEFTSICKTLTIELVITPSESWAHFDYSITLTDALIGTDYDVVKGSAMTVTEIKDMLQTCVLAYNAENPAFEAERAEYDAAYKALKNFSDDLIEKNSEKLALETLLAVAVEQGKEKAAARLTDLLTNDFDYENNGYMISSLEHSYQDLYIWDAATVHQLAEVIQYIDSLGTTPAAPALSNLDAEKAIIDVTITVKVGGNGGGFAWCAESEEYKVFADSKADAIKEIKEAMILDGITNPVLNIINPERYTVSVGRETAKAATLEEAITISKGWLSTNYSPVIEKVKTEGCARYCGGFTEGSIIDHDFVEPTSPATEPTPEAPEAPEATEGDNVSDYTISTVFAQHGYSKAACEGLDIIYDDKGEQITSIRGSLRTRLAMKWLIVDALVNGRCEQQNEDDFAALATGEAFTLTFENGSTAEATKADNMRVKFLAYGRETILLFQRNWLVTPEATSEQSNIEKFKALPMGEPIEIELGNGQSVEAYKRSDSTFVFNNFGTFVTRIVTPRQRLNIGFPTMPNYKLITDLYNSKKQYILKRENFQEITVFQLVEGDQVGRVKLTERELLATYDFMYQYQLNKLFSAGSNSASRLYKIKHSFLDGISKNWRIDAKLLCINPDSLNFLTHVAREEALKPLIVRTAKAMKAVSGWGSWWLNKPVDAVLREAEAAGYVVRRSHTQIGWSDTGLAELKKYA